MYLCKMIHEWWCFQQKTVQYANRFIDQAVGFEFLRCFSDFSVFLEVIAYAKAAGIIILPKSNYE